MWLGPLGRTQLEWSSEVRTGHSTKRNALGSVEDVVSSRGAAARLSDVVAGSLGLIKHVGKISAHEQRSAAEWDCDGHRGHESSTCG